MLSDRHQVLKKNNLEAAAEQFKTLKESLSLTESNASESFTSGSSQMSDLIQAQNLFPNENDLCTKPQRQKKLKTLDSFSFVSKQKKSLNGSDELSPLASILLAYNLLCTLVPPEDKQIISNPFSLFVLGENDSIKQPLEVWKTFPTNTVYGISPEYSRRCRYVGLKNLGATCYMNSYLQSLYMNIDFRSRIFDALTSVETQQLDIVKEIKNLFATLQLGFFHVADPLRVAKALKIATDDQEDTTEFATLLLTSLEKELGAVSPLQNFIPTLFRGFLAQTVTCEACKTVSRRTDEFYELRVQIPREQRTVSTENSEVTSSGISGSQTSVSSRSNRKLHNSKSLIPSSVSTFDENDDKYMDEKNEKLSETKDSFLKTSKKHSTVVPQPLFRLEEALNSLFRPEVFSEDNQYMCQSCNDKVDAQRKLCLAQVPPYLHICLERYTYENGERKKLTTNADYPLVLDFKPYIEKCDSETESSNEKDDYTYELIGILEHHGNSALSGHYVAYLKDLTKTKPDKELQAGVSDSLVVIDTNEAEILKNNTTVSSTEANKKSVSSPPVEVSVSKQQQSFCSHQDSGTSTNKALSVSETSSKKFRGNFKAKNASNVEEVFLPLMKQFASGTTNSSERLSLTETAKLFQLWMNIKKKVCSQNISKEGQIFNKFLSRPSSLSKVSAVTQTQEKTKSLKTSIALQNKKNLQLKQATKRVAISDEKKQESVKKEVKNKFQQQPLVWENVSIKTNSNYSTTFEDNHVLPYFKEQTAFAPLKKKIKNSRADVTVSSPLLVAKHRPILQPQLKTNGTLVTSSPSSSQLFSSSLQQQTPSFLTPNQVGFNPYLTGNAHLKSSQHPLLYYCYPPQIQTIPQPRIGFAPSTTTNSRVYPFLEATGQPPSPYVQNLLVNSSPVHPVPFIPNPMYNPSLSMLSPSFRLSFLNQLQRTSSMALTPNTVALSSVHSSSQQKHLQHHQSCPQTPLLQRQDSTPSQAPNLHSCFLSDERLTAGSRPPSLENRNQTSNSLSSTLPVNNLSFSSSHVMNSDEQKKSSRGLKGGNRINCNFSDKQKEIKATENKKVNSNKMIQEDCSDIDVFQTDNEKTKNNDLHKKPFSLKRNKLQVLFSNSESFTQQSVSEALQYDKMSRFLSKSNNYKADEEECGDSKPQLSTFQTNSAQPNKLYSKKQKFENEKLESDKSGSEKSESEKTDSEIKYEETNESEQTQSEKFQCEGSFKKRNFDVVEASERNTHLFASPPAISKVKQKTLTYHPRRSRHTDDFGKRWQWIQFDDASVTEWKIQNFLISSQNENQAITSHRLTSCSAYLILYKRRVWEPCKVKLPPPDALRTEDFFQQLPVHFEKQYTTLAKHFEKLTLERHTVVSTYLKPIIRVLLERAESIKKQVYTATKKNEDFLFNLVLSKFSFIPTSWWSAFIRGVDFASMVSMLRTTEDHLTYLVERSSNINVNSIGTIQCSDFKENSDDDDEQNNAVFQTNEKRISCGRNQSAEDALVVYDEVLCPHYSRSRLEKIVCNNTNSDDFNSNHRKVISNEKPTKQDELVKTESEDAKMSSQSPCVSTNGGIHNAATPEKPQDENKETIEFVSSSHVGEDFGIDPFTVWDGRVKLIPEALLSDIFRSYGIAANIPTTNLARLTCKICSLAILQLIDYLTKQRSCVLILSRFVRTYKIIATNTGCLKKTNTPVLMAKDSIEQKTAISHTVSSSTVRAGSNNNEEPNFMQLQINKDPLISNPEQKENSVEFAHENLSISGNSSQKTELKADRVLVTKHQPENNKDETEKKQFPSSNLHHSENKQQQHSIPEGSPLIWVSRKVISELENRYNLRDQKTKKNSYDRFYDFRHAAEDARKLVLKLRDQAIKKKEQQFEPNQDKDFSDKEWVTKTSYQQPKLNFAEHLACVHGKLNPEIRKPGLRVLAPKSVLRQFLELEELKSTLLHEKLSVPVSTVTANQVVCSVFIEVMTWNYTDTAKSIHASYTKEDIVCKECERIFEEEKLRLQAWRVFVDSQKQLVGENVYKRFCKIVKWHSDEKRTATYSFEEGRHYLVPNSWIMTYLDYIGAKDQESAVIPEAITGKELFCFCKNQTQLAVDPMSYFHGLKSLVLPIKEHLRHPEVDFYLMVYETEFKELEKLYTVKEEIPYVTFSREKFLNSEKLDSIYYAYSHPLCINCVKKLRFAPGGVGDFGPITLRLEGDRLANNLSRTRRRSLTVSASTDLQEMFQRALPLLGFTDNLLTPNTKKKFVFFLEGPAIHPFFDPKDLIVAVEDPRSPPQCKLTLSVTAQGSLRELNTMLDNRWSLSVQEVSAV